MQDWIMRMTSIEEVRQQRITIKREYETVSEQATYDRNKREYLETLEKDLDDLELRLDQLAQEKTNEEIKKIPVGLGLLQVS